MTHPMPLSLTLRLNAAISSALYGFDFHSREDLVKIWMQSHPIDLPRPIDSATPPAIDICAPSSGRPMEALVVICKTSDAILYDAAAKSRAAKKIATACRLVRARIFILRVRFL